MCCWKISCGRVISGSQTGTKLLFVRQHSNKPVPVNLWKKAYHVFLTNFNSLKTFFKNVQVSSAG